MVEVTEKKALQVDDISGDLKGHDLSFAAGQQLVVAAEPFDDDLAFGRPLALDDDILVSVDVFRLRQGSRERLLLLLGERAKLLKLFDQEVQGSLP
jgi:hypothetical protein